MKRFICSTALVAAIVLLAAMGSRALAEEGLPEGVKGFSGQVRGVVTARGGKNTFTFKVARVLKVWKNNKAENPEALVGLSVLVRPRWVKRDNGRWHPVEIHAAFIRKLKVNQELTLEIRNDEGNAFSILELSKEQREWATGGGEGGESGDKEEALPEGVRGFSGQVRGVVKAKGDGNTFRFHVGRVLKVWKNNKAKNPEALAGRTVRVGPRWVQGENGKWHPLEGHIAFIRQLKVGQELTLEIFNAEASHFNLLELSAEQRESAMKRIEGSLSEEGRKDEGLRKMLAITQEMRKEMRRLRAENAELRRKIEQLEAKQKD